MKHIIFFVLIFSVQFALAQIPQTLSYQGLLTDVQGNVVFIFHQYFRWISPNLSLYCPPSSNRHIFTSRLPSSVRPNSGIEIRV